MDARIKSGHDKLVPPALRARVMHGLSLENGGRRECRVPAAPAASRAKQKSSVVTTGPPVSPSIPCAMVLTAYFALPPVTGLSCHRRLADTSAKLDASVGAPGPHDFAVRAGAARLPTPPASIASRTNVRDDAYAPLIEAGQSES